MKRTKVESDQTKAIATKSSRYSSTLMGRQNKFKNVSTGNKTAVDITSPKSPLTGINLKLLINSSTFTWLPSPYQKQLLSLLPACDQQPSVSFRKLPFKADALNNEFFSKACIEWKQKLSKGNYINGQCYKKNLLPLISTTSSLSNHRNDATNVDDVDMKNDNDYDDIEASHSSPCDQSISSPPTQLPVSKSSQNSSLSSQSLIHRGNKPNQSAVKHVQNMQPTTARVFPPSKNTSSTSNSMISRRKNPHKDVDKKPDSTTNVVKSGTESQKQFKSKSFVTFASSVCVDRSMYCRVALSKSSVNAATIKTDSKIISKKKTSLNVDSKLLNTEKQMEHCWIDRNDDVGNCNDVKYLNDNNGAIVDIGEVDCKDEIPGRNRSQLSSRVNSDSVLDSFRIAWLRIAQEHSYCIPMYNQPLVVSSSSAESLSSFENSETSYLTGNSSCLGNLPLIVFDDDIPEAWGMEETVGMEEEENACFKNLSESGKMSISPKSLTEEVPLLSNLNRFKFPNQVSDSSKDLTNEASLLNNSFSFQQKESVNFTDLFENVDVGKEEDSISSSIIIVDDDWNTSFQGKVVSKSVETKSDNKIFKSVGELDSIENIEKLLDFESAAYRSFWNRSSNKDLTKQSRNDGGLPLTNVSLVSSSKESIEIDVGTSADLEILPPLTKLPPGKSSGRVRQQLNEKAKHSIQSHACSVESHNRVGHNNEILKQPLEVELNENSQKTLNFESVDVQVPGSVNTKTIDSGIGSSIEKEMFNKGSCPRLTRLSPDKSPSHARQRLKEVVKSKVQNRRYDIEPCNRSAKDLTSLGLYRLSRGTRSRPTIISDETSHSDKCLSSGDHSTSFCNENRISVSSSENVINRCTISSGTPASGKNLFSGDSSASCCNESRTSVLNWPTYFTDDVAAHRIIVNGTSHSRKNLTSSNPSSSSCNESGTLKLSASSSKSVSVQSLHKSLSTENVDVEVCDSPETVQSRSCSIDSHNSKNSSDSSIDVCNGEGDCECGSCSESSLDTSSSNNNNSRSSGCNNRSDKNDSSYNSSTLGSDNNSHSDSSSSDSNSNNGDDFNAADKGRTSSNVNSNNCNSNNCNSNNASDCLDIGYINRNGTNSNISRSTGSENCKSNDRDKVGHSDATNNSMKGFTVDYYRMQGSVPPPIAVNGYNPDESLEGNSSSHQTASWNSSLNIGLSASVSMSHSPLCLVPHKGDFSGQFEERNVTVKCEKLKLSNCGIMDLDSPSPSMIPNAVGSRKGRRSSRDRAKDSSFNEINSNNCAFQKSNSSDHDFKFTSTQEPSVENSSSKNSDFKIHCSSSENNTANSCIWESIHRDFNSMNESKSIDSSLRDCNSNDCRSSKCSSDTLLHTRKLSLQPFVNLCRVDAKSHCCFGESDRSWISTSFNRHCQNASITQPNLASSNILSFSDNKETDRHLVINSTSNCCQILKCENPQMLDGQCDLKYDNVADTSNNCHETTTAFKQCDQNHKDSEFKSIFSKDCCEINSLLTSKSLVCNGDCSEMKNEVKCYFTGVMKNQCNADTISINSNDQIVVANCDLNTKYHSTCKGSSVSFVSNYNESNKNCFNGRSKGLICNQSHSDCSHGRNRNVSDHKDKTHITSCLSASVSLPDGCKKCQRISKNCSKSDLRSTHKNSIKHSCLLNTDEVKNCSSEVLNHSDEINYASRNGSVDKAEGFNSGKGLNGKELIDKEFCGEGGSFDINSCNECEYGKDFNRGKGYFENDIRSDNGKIFSKICINDTGGNKIGSTICSSSCYYSIECDASEIDSRRSSCNKSFSSYCTGSASYCTSSSSYCTADSGTCDSQSSCTISSNGSDISNHRGVSNQLSHRFKELPHRVRNSRPLCVRVIKFTHGKGANSVEPGLISLKESGNVLTLFKDGIKIGSGKLCEGQFVLRASISKVDNSCEN